jgi:DNA-binding MarR family transcriptional regulator
VARRPARGARASDPLLFSLLEAAHALGDRLEAALKAVGLSWPKYAVLSQLARAGEPLTLRALAEEQRCVPSNITQLVDRLEGEGLVRRVDDPADRRSVRAALTPRGEARAAAGAEAVERMQAAFAASLTAADRAALGRLLAAIK